MKKYRIGFDGDRYTIQGKKKFSPWESLPYFSMYTLYYDTLEAYHTTQELFIKVKKPIKSDPVVFDTFERAYEEIHKYKDYFEKLNKVKRIVYTEI